MDKTVTLFKSKTRLYTNFCFGEHKEDYVLREVGVSIRQALENIPLLLSEDNFIECVLQGALTTDLGFASNIRDRYKINLKELKPAYVQWLRDFFQSPSLFLKEVSLIEDTDGSLAVDVDVEVSLSVDYMQKHIHIGPKKSFEVRAAKLSALYNILVGAKYLLFKRIQQSLRASPGVSIDDICDIHLLEHMVDRDGKEIILSELSVNMDEDTTKTHLHIDPKMHLVR